MQSTADLWARVTGGKPADQAGQAPQGHAPQAQAPARPSLLGNVGDMVGGMQNMWKLMSDPDLKDVMIELFRAGVDQALSTQRTEYKLDLLLTQGGRDVDLINAQFADLCRERAEHASDPRDKLAALLGFAPATGARSAGPASAPPDDGGREPARDHRAAGGARRKA